ncbi:MAG TPA: sigma-70 family RNA polymerase sigma factor [Gemmataceae bacterium]|nr:sigma-70 family RNA polymerase sigma factor [Gemmataceae bacterium]
MPAPRLPLLIPVRMIDTNSQFAVLQQLLPRAVAGDATALDALLRHCSDRLTLLTRHMLGDFQRVRRWAETDDVLQNSLVRLMSALRDVKPTTTRDFYALATLQIRRELIDLARHYYGPEGLGANHDSRLQTDATAQGRPDPSDVRHEPSNLAQWTELHEQIGALPEEEREVVGLLFYQGLSQAEAAEVLGMSLRTLQRRWHTALCKLHRVWNRE